MTAAMIGTLVMLTVSWAPAQASAAVICSTTGTTNATACPPGAHDHEYSGPIHLTAKGAGGSLVTSLVTVVCPAPTTEVLPSGSTGTTEIEGAVETLTLGPGCHLTNAKETACTTEVQGLPYVVHIIGTVNGETRRFTIRETGPRWHMTCGSIINCTFSAEVMDLEGEDVEAEEGLVATASEVAMSRTGGLCPSTAKWSAEFMVAQVTIH